MYELLGWRVLASTKIDGKDVVAVDKGNRRELVYDHVIHSQIYKNSIYTRQYWDYFTPIPAVFQKSKILIIGLGGGTMPFQIKKVFGKKVKIDVVEINREIVRLSKALLPKRLDAKIIIGDGYSYVSGKRGAYDLIISDAFLGKEIPDEFFKANYIQNVHRALNETGIFAINYILNPKDLLEKSHLMKELRKLFNVYILNYPHSAGNIVIVCSKKYEKQEIISKMEKNFPKDDENGFLLRAYSRMT